MMGGECKRRPSICAVIPPAGVLRTATRLDEGRTGRRMAVNTQIVSGGESELRYGEKKIGIPSFSFCVNQRAFGELTKEQRRYKADVSQVWLIKSFHGM